MSVYQRISLLAVLAGVASVTGCDGPRQSRAPEGSASLVISLQNIDCQSRGTKVVETLEARPGVYEASFERTLGEVTVLYDKTATGFEDFKADIEGHGYVPLEGPGQGAYLPEVEFPDELDMVKLTVNGEPVDLEANLVPGKVTVFDYYAVWCKPCREVDGHMRDVLTASPDVALRKLNVVDWDSPLAKAHLGSVASLPYVVVYDVNGSKVGAISGLHLDELDAAIEKGRAP